MKRILHKFLILIFIVFFFEAGAQTVVESQRESTILVFHPSVRNIQTIMYLVEKDIFRVPDNFHIIGVFHKNASYNYALSSSYISEKNFTNITLIEVTDTLHPGNLFIENHCLPLFGSLIGQSSGAILFGGPDIPPICYGEKTNLLTEINDPFRHYLELAFVFAALGGSQKESFEPLLLQHPEYAILGICLGMQTLNVGTGGTLIQDIPTQIFNVFTAEDLLQLDIEQRHRNYFVHIDNDPDLIYGHFHCLYYEKEALFDILNLHSQTTPYVWSSHHQCIGKVGKNILPVAYSKDQKIIEAVIHENFPNALGVQFHPEIVSIFNDTVSLKLQPGQLEVQSFSEMFPGQNGYDFHISFWKHVSGLFFRKFNE